MFINTVEKLYCGIPEKHFYLISNGEEIGHCVIKCNNELMNLHIYGNWQRKGFGKYFLQEIMKTNKFHLYCDESKNPFYLSCGLIKTGTRRFYYRGELTVFSNEL